MEGVVLAVQQFQFLHDVLCIGNDDIVHHVDDTIGTGGADKASQFSLIVEEDAVGTVSFRSPVGIVHIRLHISIAQSEIFVEEVLCLDISVFPGYFNQG